MEGKKLLNTIMKIKISQKKKQIISTNIWPKEQKEAKKEYGRNRHKNMKENYVKEAQYKFFVQYENEWKDAKIG